MVFTLALCVRSFPSVILGQKGEMGCAEIMVYVYVRLCLCDATALEFSFLLLKTDISKWFPGQLRRKK